MRSPDPDRRAVLAGAAASMLAPTTLARAAATAAGPPPSPITPAEHQARVGLVQARMRAAGIAALLVEPGASLIYFTGVHWSRSERLTAAVIPADGPVTVVTPFFEAPSVRQTLRIVADVRTWQEDENPLALVAALLPPPLAGKPVAIEETVRYFIVDGLRRVAPDRAIVSGAALVRACRMMKSPAELALMQHATDITIAAYAETIPRVRPGMTPPQIGAMMDAATVARGGSPEFALVLVGPASALPHGSHEPQVVQDGAVVLMDCGCTVEGYQSDVSRTFVPGGAAAEQRRVWEQVAHGQRIALAAARIGAPAGTVDDAVRAYYRSLGYGPGYALPGLSHRTGHGIGLDGHEPVNLVHGEMTPLAAGMCFSNEPGLYLPGRFGIRIEDCFHMTPTGPRWFSEPPRSIDAVLG